MQGNTSRFYRSLTKGEDKVLCKELVLDRNKSASLVSAWYNLFSMKLVKPKLSRKERNLDNYKDTLQVRENNRQQQRVLNLFSESIGSDLSGSFAAVKF